MKIKNIELHNIGLYKTQKIDVYSPSKSGEISLSVFLVLNYIGFQFIAEFRNVNVIQRHVRYGGNQYRKG